MDGEEGGRRRREEGGRTRALSLNGKVEAGDELLGFWRERFDAFDGR